MVCYGQREIACFWACVPKARASSRSQPGTTDPWYLQHQPQAWLSETGNQTNLWINWQTSHRHRWMHCGCHCLLIPTHIISYFDFLFFFHPQSLIQKEEKWFQCFLLERGNRNWHLGLPRQLEFSGQRTSEEVIAYRGSSRNLYEESL